jgi:peptidoglycan/xylan/chitin deacetylase (PgdA/CDA1 family)
VLNPKKSNPKHRIKRNLATALRLMNLFGFIRFIQKKRLTIVMYHRFSDVHEPFKLHHTIFDMHLRFFKSKYNIISFNTLIASFRKKTPLPRNPLIITIDDGYYDNFSIAYPLLKKYAAPATIFLATDFVSENQWLWPNKLEFILKKSLKPNFTLTLGKSPQQFSVDNFSSWHKTQLALFNYLRHRGDEKDQFLIDLAKYLHVELPDKTTSEFKSLDWSHIIEMHQHNISFGSHTCSHPILSSIDRKDQHNEIFQSKHEIEYKLGNKINVFCYPNGQPQDYNQEVINAVNKAGYQLAVTTVNGNNLLPIAHPFELKRKGVMMADQLALELELIKS